MKKGTIIIPKSKQHVQGSVPAPAEPTQEQKAPKGIIIIPKNKQKPKEDLIIEEVLTPTPETPEEVIDVVPEPAPEAHTLEQLPEPEPEAAPTQEQIPAPEPAPVARTRVVRINPQMTQRIEHYRPTRRERKGWEPVTQLGQFFLWIHNNGGLF